MRGRLLRLAVLLMGCAILFSGCGKKASPFLPKRDFSLKVVDLKGTWEDGAVVLTGRVQGSGHKKGEADRIKGCRVYYGQYPAENPPCETCPIRYQGYHSLKAEVVKGEVFSCNVPIKAPGQITFLKVHLVGTDGAIGPPSARIRISK